MTDCICCGCVEQDQVAIIERCGAFHDEGAPGFICLPVPWVYILRSAVSMRIRQLNVRCETKTKDNVFVDMVVGIQFQVEEKRAKDAFYLMSNPEGQINSYVYDVVRSSVPKMELDQVFENKHTVASDIAEQLGEQMNKYGYKIHKALVIDVSPALVVKQSMNEINANKRLRLAAFEKAEAEKIVLVKRAEAEAESKYLQGEGIARQRGAIVEGLRDSVGEFTEKIAGMSAKDVLELVLITQYFDTLKDIGERSANTIFFPHNPGALNQISDEIKNNFSARKAKAIMN
eukprot:GEMP01038001.1.p1 GENE.GEMP01038001.1~~GEMP01038001.1.p1  ORF type:complete len:288 (+),score=69.35 GEMP01038001.1:172-1035(+)